jgi:hypothetical protein
MQIREAEFTDDTNGFKPVTDTVVTPGSVTLNLKDRSPPSIR